MTDNLQTSETDTAHPPRRTFLRGVLATGGLAVLPACTSFGGFGLTDAVQRLLFLSSERAFARMLQADGFWDSQVAQLGLADLLGSRGRVLDRILTSSLFKSRLETAFGDIAYEGAERAAPLVTDAVRVIGIQNAIALVNGGPRAATTFLRGSMGTTLVEAMDAVTPFALRRIESAADLWLSRQPDHARLSIRFDLVAILPRRWPVHVPAIYP